MGCPVGVSPIGICDAHLGLPKKNLQPAIAMRTTKTTTINATNQPGISLIFATSALRQVKFGYQ